MCNCGMWTCSCIVRLECKMRTGYRKRNTVDWTRDTKENKVHRLPGFTRRRDLFFLSEQQRNTTKRNNNSTLICNSSLCASINSSVSLFGFSYVNVITRADRVINDEIEILCWFDWDSIRTTTDKYSSLAIFHNTTANLEQWKQWMNANRLEWTSIYPELNQYSCQSEQWLN